MNLFDEKVLRQHLWFNRRIMVASIPLLSRAVHQCGMMSLFDLQKYYAEHLKEEDHHAEWLLDDLGEADNGEIDWTAACIAGTQYYLLNHYHPALLLGYMQALEVPCPIQLIDDLEIVHGRKLIRTLRHHAEVDGRHGEEIAAMIEKMPGNLKDKIEQNRQATVALINSVLQRYT